MNAILEKFLQQYQSPQTVKSYRSKINLFLQFLKEKNKNLETILDIDIIEFLQNKRKSTANTYLNAIRGFYKYATKKELPLKNFNVSTYRPDRYLSMQEAQTLVLQCSNFRDKLILKLAIETGIRVNEIASLQKQNIKQKGQNYFLDFIAKGRKHRSVKISKELARYLQGFDSQKSTIFGISDRQIQRIVKDLGLKILKRPVTPHCLRHCFATELFKQGVAFHCIQQALGHDNISTTLRYIHNKQDKHFWYLSVQLSHYF